MAAVVALSLALSVGGTWALAQYSQQPGSAGITPAVWPEGTGLRLDAARPTLVLFAHARCPCSRASLSELEAVLAGQGDAVSAQVLMYRPRGERSASWESELWERAGVLRAWDEGGEAAARFGVATSGHVVLYAPDGRLLFTGGVTRSRGHEGDSAARRALIAAVKGEAAGAIATRVFGCALTGAASIPCGNAP